MQYPPNDTCCGYENYFITAFQQSFAFRTMATVVSFGILFGQKKSENAISSIRTSSTRAGGAIKDSGLLAG
jgi:hypothetical protein